MWIRGFLCFVNMFSHLTYKIIPVFVKNQETVMLSKETTESELKESSLKI